MQLFIKVCANDLYSHLCNWMFISVIYIYMLFYCRQSKSHGLLAAIVCVIIGLRTHFLLQTCLPRITHILFSWTVSIVLPNHTQFILVNYMPYITHTLIWPVSVVLHHRKQFFWIKSLPLIAHANLIWTMFDVAAIANVLHLFYGFITSPFAINASHKVSAKGL